MPGHDHELSLLLAQIRTHLEFQRALGVKELPIVARGSAPAPAHNAPKRGADIAPATAKPASVPASELQHTQRSTMLSASPSDGQEDLDAVRAALGACTRCKLCSGRTNIVFGEGNPHAELVFVGEGPGKDEDLEGRPFVGRAGQLLTDIIVKGMQIRREDVYICNVVKCRPPENRNPEPDEIAACEPFLLRQLRAINPKVIVALGNISVKTLLKTKAGITTLRGKWHTYHDIPLMPTFHPAYLLRNPPDKKLVWEDIQLVMKKLGLLKD